MTGFFFSEERPRDVAKLTAGSRKDIKLVAGDSHELLKHIPDNSVHLVLTSPPYDGLRDYTDGAGVNLHIIGEQVLRVLVDGGVAVVVITDQVKDGAQSGTTFRMIVDWVDLGLRLKETLIYRRRGLPGHIKTKFRNDHEYMPVFVKGQRPRVLNKQLLNKIVPNARHLTGNSQSTGIRQKDGTVKHDTVQLKLDRCRGSVWHYETSVDNFPHSDDNKLKVKHPAPFPKQLAMDHVLCWTNPGDLVLDPFGGSGTTALACLASGRKCIHMDISNEYIDLAHQRLELFTRTNQF